MVFLMQQLSLPFLYHKLAITCQIDSGKVLNSKLKPDLCNCVKNRGNWIHSSSTGATQTRHNYFGMPCIFSVKVVSANGKCELAKCR